MRIEVEVPEAAVPGQHGVYVAFDGNGDVLYIGMTRDLVQRFSTHRSQSDWFPRMRSLEFTPCDGPNEARVVEKSMIAAFRPESNIVDFKPQQRSTRQQLPDWTVAKLVTLHEATRTASDRAAAAVANDRLNCYIKALRDGGWTLAAIGCGLSMTREGVRIRAARASKSDSSPGVPALPVKPKPTKKVKPTIPTARLAELRTLQADAMRVNGPTPLDSPLRAASERYTELIAEQYVAGVSIYRIAKQLGVTHLAIKARLARHGYLEEVKGLPSNVKYGTPWKADSRFEKGTCKRGHDVTDESNVRWINGDRSRRICRACERIRREEYLARKAERSGGAA